MPNNDIPLWERLLLLAFYGPLPVGLISISFLALESPLWVALAMGLALGLPIGDRIGCWVSRQAEKDLEKRAQRGREYNARFEKERYEDH